MMFSDPTGLWIDALADLGFIIYDIYQISQDDGCDPAATAINAAALTADIGGLFTPVATGLGLGVRATAKAATDAAKKAKKKGLGNPFKNKTAKEIDAMFIKKEFIKRGPDPAGGTGGYINPKTGRSYHIDPKTWGKYPEPNHVDVNRLKPYKNKMDKKKFPYKEN